MRSAICGALAAVLLGQGVVASALNYQYNIPTGFDPLQGWVEIRVVSSGASAAVKPTAEDQVYVELWAFGLVTQHGTIAIGYDPAVLQPSLVKNVTLNGVPTGSNTLLQDAYPYTNTNADATRYDLSVQFSQTAIADNQYDMTAEDLLWTGNGYTVIADSGDPYYFVLEYELRDSFNHPSTSDQELATKAMLDEGILNGISKNDANPQYAVNVGSGECIMRMSFKRVRDAGGKMVPITTNSLWVKPFTAGMDTTITSLKTGIYIHNGAVDTGIAEEQKWFLTDASRVPFIMEGIMAAPEPNSVKATNLNTGYSFRVNVQDVVVPDGTGGYATMSARKALEDGHINGFVVYTPDNVRIEVAGPAVDGSTVGGITMTKDTLIKQANGSVDFFITADETSSFIDYIVNGAGTNSTVHPNDKYKISCIQKQTDTNIEGTKVPFDLDPIRGMNISFDLTSYAPKHATSIWLYQEVGEGSGVYHNLPYLYIKTRETSGAGQQTKNIVMNHVAAGTYRLKVEKAGHITCEKDAFLVITEDETNGQWIATLGDGGQVSCSTSQSIPVALTDALGDPYELELFCGDVNPVPGSEATPEGVAYGDGSITLADRTFLQEYLTRTKSVPEYILEGTEHFVLDLDGDGKVTLADLVILNRYYGYSASFY